MHMDISIIKEQELPLLGRRDVSVRIAFEGATPGRAVIRSALGKKLHGKEELVVVRRINTSFGEQVAIIEASVYKDDAHLTRYELEYVRKRHGSLEAAAAPAAEGE
jgi:ribosomal protein S24E